MAITRAAYPPRVNPGWVAFDLVGHGKLVTVYATKELLAKVGDISLRTNDLLSVFELNYERIERAARLKYEAGLARRDGTIVLMIADLHD